MELDSNNMKSFFRSGRSNKMAGENINDDWEGIVNDAQNQQATGNTVDATGDAERDENNTDEPTSNQNSDVNNDAAAHTPKRKRRGRPRNNSTPAQRVTRRTKKNSGKQSAKDVEIDYLNQCLSDENKKVQILDKKLKDLRLQLHKEQKEKQSYADENVKLKNRIAALDKVQKGGIKTDDSKKIDDLNQSIKDKDEQIAELQQESTEKDIKIADLQEMLADQREESQSILKRYVGEKQVKCREKKESVVWIMDKVHEDEIKKRIPKNETCEIFTIESVKQLSEIEESEQFRKSVSKCKVIIYLVGSNDLGNMFNTGNKVCDDTEEIYNYISLSCERMKKLKPVAILTVPPTKVKGTMSEVPYLNSMIINGLQSDCIVIDNHMKLSSSPKSRVIGKNGISVIDEGANIIVKSVGNMLTSTLKRHKSVSDDHKSVSDDLSAISSEVNKENDDSRKSVSESNSEELFVEVPSVFMKHIVGKFQKGLQRIEQESGAKLEIQKTQTENGTKESIRVSGSEQNCKTAVEIIHQVIKDQKAKSYERSEKVEWPSRSGRPYQKESNKIECKFYLQGNCVRGDRCPYTHPEGPRRKIIKLD